MQLLRAQLHKFKLNVEGKRLKLTRSHDLCVAHLADVVEPALHPAAHRQHERCHALMCGHTLPHG